MCADSYEIYLQEDPSPGEIPNEAFPTGVRFRRLREQTEIMYTLQSLLEGTGFGTTAPGRKSATIFSNSRWTCLRVRRLPGFCEIRRHPTRHAVRCTTAVLYSSIQPLQGLRQETMTGQIIPERSHLRGMCYAMCDCFIPHNASTFSLGVGDTSTDVTLTRTSSPTDRALKDGCSIVAITRNSGMYTLADLSLIPKTTSPAGSS
jgi:hypothetical protein